MNWVELNWANVCKFSNDVDNGWKMYIFTKTNNTDVNKTAKKTLRFERLFALKQQQQWQHNAEMIHDGENDFLASFFLPAPVIAYFVCKYPILGGFTDSSVDS